MMNTDAVYSHRSMHGRAHNHATASQLAQQH